MNTDRVVYENFKDNYPDKWWDQIQTNIRHISGKSSVYKTTLDNPCSECGSHDFVVDGFHKEVACLKCGLVRDICG